MNHDQLRSLTLDISKLNIHRHGIYIFKSRAARGARAYAECIAARTRMHCASAHARARRAEAANLQGHGRVCDKTAAQGVRHKLCTPTCAALKVPTAGHQNGAHLAGPASQVPKPGSETGLIAAVTCALMIGLRLCKDKWSSRQGLSTSERRVKNVRNDVVCCPHNL